MTVAEPLRCAFFDAVATIVVCPTALARASPEASMLTMFVSLELQRMGPVDESDVAAKVIRSPRARLALPGETPMGGTTLMRAAPLTVGSALVAATIVTFPSAAIP